MNFCRLISLLMTTLLAVAEPILAAQWSPSLSTVIQDANKEGKLKLMWGEGTLGGTKGAAKFETMMNKMFGTNIKIGFTPGAAMPQMGSQIAAEYAAGQSARARCLGETSRVACRPQPRRANNRARRRGSGWAHARGTDARRRREA